MLPPLFPVFPGSTAAPEHCMLLNTLSYTHSVTHPNYHSHSHPVSRSLSPSRSPSLSLYLTLSLSHSHYSFSDSLSLYLTLTLTLSLTLLMQTNRVYPKAINFCYTQDFGFKMKSFVPISEPSNDIQVRFRGNHGQRIILETEDVETIR